MKYEKKPTQIEQLLNTRLNLLRPLEMLKYQGAFLWHSNAKDIQTVKRHENTTNI